MICKNEQNKKVSRTWVKDTRQVTRATHVRNRICPRVELILLLIIFLGFINVDRCKANYRIDAIKFAYLKKCAVVHIFIQGNWRR